MELNLIKQLINDLQIYTNSCYGGYQRFIISLVLTRFIIIFFSKVLFYISEKNEPMLIDQAVDQAIVEVQNTVEKIHVKTFKRERAKKFLKKILPIRGGHSATLSAARFLNKNSYILTWILHLLRVLRGHDFQMVPYDLYMRTAVLSGNSKEICNDPESLFGYIFSLYGTNKNSGSSISPDQQQADFSDEFFKGNKLQSKSINQKHIVTFLSCTVFMIKMLMDIPDGEGFITIRAFFKSLIQAIREGKISPNVAKLLIRRLRKNRISVPRELEEALEQAIAH